MQLWLIAPITVRSYLYGLFVLPADWIYRYIHVPYIKMSARPYLCKVPYISWFICYGISIAMDFCQKKCRFSFLWRNDFTILLEVFIFSKYLLYFWSICVLYEILHNSLPFLLIHVNCISPHAFWNRIENYCQRHFLWNPFKFWLHEITIEGAHRIIYLES